MTAPFGLNQVFAVVNGQPYPFEVPRGFKFKEVVTTAEFDTEDGPRVETVPEAIEFEIEAGGMPLLTFAALTGRTKIVSGATPNAQTALAGRAAEFMPEFDLLVRSLDDGADQDLFLSLSLCRLTGSLQGAFQDGQFFAGQLKGLAVSPDPAVALFTVARRSGYFAHAIGGGFTVAVSTIGGPDAIS